jgi:hypothetical protein
MDKFKKPINPYFQKRCKADSHSELLKIAFFFSIPGHNANVEIRFS